MARRSFVPIVAGLGVVTVMQIVGAQAPELASLYTYSRNLQPIGESPRRAPVTESGSAVYNSDLAFAGQSVYQGTYEGFRIIDVSSPATPRVIVNFADCVQGTTEGNQGDVVVHRNLLVRSWNTPAPSGGSMCGGIFTPQGQQGVHLFDITNPASPVGISFVNTACGSHTAMAVPDPDPANDRLLVYSSSSDDNCPWIDVIQIPLSDPASASVLRAVLTSRRCHDGGVILGAAMLAACAGADGFTMLTLDPAKGGALDNPKVLYSVAIPGVDHGHSAAFSWDGEVLIFGHEPGGGVEARCEATTSVTDRSLFFYEADTGALLGTFLHPRPQTSTENCTWHYYNVVPTDQRRILVSGNYQSGIIVVDFTDPAHAKEIAFADPAPIDPTMLVVGGDWSAYWYNGFIYESSMRDGLRIWRLNDMAVAGAKRLPHLNPQTQESTFP